MTTEARRERGSHLTSKGMPKRGYTKAEAKAAVKVVRSRGGAADLRSYKCDECGNYHLGNYRRAADE